MLLHRSSTDSSERGFTIVELTVVIVVIGFFMVGFYVFFNTVLTQYFSLQRQGTNFSDLSSQTQRVAQVLRGLTDITEASADDITCYAYFEPSDTYVSLVHYYKNPTNTALLVDVTPMDANPPNGNPITSEEKTYTVIPNFYQASGTSTFVYLDSSNNAITEPVADLTTIKGIEINLAVPAGDLSGSSHQTLTLEVNLRNRKTNL